jgi:hypothetical protein
MSRRNIGISWIGSFGILKSRRARQEYKEIEAKLLLDVATPKKKKTSYKAMMEGMMSGSGTSTDVEKQKDKIRSATGRSRISSTTEISQSTL